MNTAQLFINSYLQPNECLPGRLLYSFYALASVVQASTEKAYLTDYRYSSSSSVPEVQVVQEIQSTEFHTRT